MLNLQMPGQEPSRDVAGPGASNHGEVATLDAQALAGLRELDPTGANRLLERVVKAYQDSLDRLVPQLLEARSKSDATGLRHVAHTLKSSSASIGALHLSSLCAALETAVRNGASEGLDAGVDALCSEVQRVRPALEQLAPRPR